MVWIDGGLPAATVSTLPTLNPTVGGELRKVRPVVVVSQNERNGSRYGRRLSPHLHVAPAVAEPPPDTLRGARQRKSPWTGFRTIGKQRLRRRLDRLSSEHAPQLRRIITEMYGNDIDGEYGG